MKTSYILFSRPKLNFNVRPCPCVSWTPKFVLGAKKCKSSDKLGTKKWKNTVFRVKNGYFRCFSKTVKKECVKLVKFDEIGGHFATKSAQKTPRRSAGDRKKVLKNDHFFQVILGGHFGYMACQGFEAIFSLLKAIFRGKVVF